MATTLQSIPLTVSGPWFAQPVTLGGTDYVLEFQYNERLGVWYLDVLDQLETPLAQGIALLSSRDLLRAHRSQALKNCMLFVYDTTNQQTDPTFDSLGVTHKLLFRVLK